ncbi:MAG: glutamine amidotransferase-related protein [candidate division WOR-3 bacterium]|jgi:GMP synthase (glutamine-hydrolysing)
MKTLLVNCYLRDAESRLVHYRQMIAPYSAVNTVEISQLLKPGFDLSGYQAVIFSGSQWMISEQKPPEPLLEFIRGLKVLTLGICFGHQLIARAFGARVGRGQLIDGEEKITIVQPWQLFSRLGSEVVMRESHQEFVTPESIATLGWEVGARSGSCAVEAVRHPSRPIYGVQFHPERSGESGAKFFAGFYSLVSDGIA